MTPVGRCFGMATLRGSLLGGAAAILQRFLRSSGAILRVSGATLRVSGAILRRFLRVSGATLRVSGAIPQRFLRVSGAIFRVFGAILRGFVIPLEGPLPGSSLGFSSVSLSCSRRLFAITFEL